MSCRALNAASALAAVLASAASALAAQTHPFLETFGSDGTEAGQLRSPTGLAVDQDTGDLYVADTGNNVIDKFDPIGALA